VQGTPGGRYPRGISLPYLPVQRGTSKDPGNAILLLPSSPRDPLSGTRICPSCRLHAGASAPQPPEPPRNERAGGCEGIPIIVSTQDIAPETRLNPLIEKDIFRTLCVSSSVVVNGAVTDVRELQDRATVATIYTNEQIPVQRLNGGGSP
jgi:hypothetical protein